MGLADVEGAGPEVGVAEPEVVEGVVVVEGAKVTEREAEMAGLEVVG